MTPAAPTTGHAFELVSRHDRNLDRERAFDAWDQTRAPMLVPDGIDPDVWAAFCETGELPEGAPPSPWRAYLDSGDHKALPTVGPLHLYTCRAISTPELEWATIQGGADPTVLHAAIVAIGLVSVSGPRAVSAAEVDRERTRAGFVKYVSWDSRLWHDDEVFPPLALHSLAGQISQRSRLPEAAATFRSAGGKV